MASKRPVKSYEKYLSQIGEPVMYRNIREEKPKKSSKENIRKNPKDPRKSPKRNPEPEHIHVSDAPEIKGRTRERMKKKKTKNAAQSRRIMGFILLIVVIAAVMHITRSDEMQLQEIRVTGNLTRSSSEIAGLSGLRLGMNILKVDCEEVRRNFSDNSAVQLLDVRLEMPNTVVIEIRERSVCAAVNCAGVILLIDRDGYVLQRRSTMPQDIDVPLVSGMDVRISPHGKKIESGTAGQITVMNRLLSAIYEVGLQYSISELNISNPDNIYVVSDSGIQVIIGNDENLSIKLGWMQAVLSTLTAEGVMSGVVDVSSGNNAVYSPN